MQALPDITSFKKRYEEIDGLMQSSDFYSDQRKAAELSREHQKLRELIQLYEGYRKLENDIAENKAIVADPASDPDLQALAQDELTTADAQLASLHQQVLVGMLPPDPSDSRNTVMEIRAGAGGDEASLFAAQLLRMYSRFSENKGWKIEPLNSSESEQGGFKTVCILIKGEEVYKTLKFESGVHRVQRVPVTEANGRIHTSTVTVAVLPEAEEVDIHIAPDDLEITVCRASGPGGQGVNTTDSAVQILHKPSGLIVNCSDERSQLKNKLKAMTILRSRLLEAKMEEERAKYAAERKGQIGSGDRSERIRTYNFPQSRLTDHRIGLTVHNLDQVMEGELEEIIHALQDADQKAKIDALNG